MDRRRMMVTVLGGGAIPETIYPFMDRFTTTRAAGAVNGTPAEPGPGNRVVIDTNSKISISGKTLQFASDAAANDGVWWDSQARVVGKTLAVQINPAIVGGRDVVGWDTNQAGAILHAIWLAASSTLQVIDAGTQITNVGEYTAATPYQIYASMNVNGVDWYIYGGAFTYPTLLWRGLGGNTALYPAIQAQNTVSIFSADNLHVLNDLYIQSSLAYDVFTRSNGAIGSTQATGYNGEASPVLAWTSQQGTWTVTTNKAKASAVDGTSGVAIATVATASADVMVDIAPSRVAGTCGMVLRYVDASNYLKATWDGTNAALIKMESGTPTTLATAAVALNSQLRLIVYGTKARFFAGGYGPSPLGSEVTVPSSTSVNHGIFTDDIQNSLDNFMVLARGTAGEHMALDDGIPAMVTNGLLAIGDSKTDGDSWVSLLATSLEASTGQHWAEQPIRIATGGWTTYNARDSVVANLPTAAGIPNKCVITLGVNDTDLTEATWKAAMTTIIDTVRAKNANCSIYIAKTWSRGGATRSNTLAGYIDAVVATYPSGVYVGHDERVWLENGDDGATYTTDGIHYNTTTAQTLVAEKWMTAFGY